MKNFSRNLSVLLFTALLFVSSDVLIAQTNLPQVPYIEVRVTATRKVTPDELYLRITINENDYKGKKSLAEMQQAMINVLKKNGVNVDEQLTVQNMGSSVKLKVFSSKIKTRTQGVYILKLSSADVMQNVISDLEEKEISNIALVETKYSKKAELENELGMEAMRQAKQRAIQLTSAIDQQIGKAIYVNYWAMNEVVTPRNYKAKNVLREVVVGEVAKDESDVKLSVTENEYSVDVNVKFELK